MLTYIPGVTASGPSVRDQQAMVTIGVAASLAGDRPDTALTRDDITRHLNDVFGQTLAPLQAASLVSFALRAILGARFNLTAVVEHASEDLDPALREEAFAFACQVALTTSAHLITPSKRAFICALARALDLSPQAIGKVLRHALIHCRVPDAPLNHLDTGSDHAGQAVALRS